jgi:hypothetical protein
MTIRHSPRSLPSGLPLVAGPGAAQNPPTPGDPLNDRERGAGAAPASE